MSENELIANISGSLDKYTIYETGSYYVLKDAMYPPWQPYDNNPAGRYNGPGTGSLYLGDTIDTCKNEVGTENKVAYKANLSEMNAQKIFDLGSWCIDNPAYSSSLLINSGSGGWEPTRQISDFVYGAGYQGIRFISQYGAEYVNLILYRDRVTIKQDHFTSIKL